VADEHDREHDQARQDAAGESDADRAEQPDAEPGAADGASAGARRSGAGARDDEDADRVDLKGIFRQLTAPMVESIDSRLREQVETHVDALLTTKVEAAVSDRLATVNRAIADLSRAVEDLERRVSELEAERDA
jgi:hypothetical protein